ncbi:PPC domain-containing protein [Chondromyces apiculatus]|uniref:Serine protease, subtilase family n=1 Tax=Chondromyces apiculatus DSM 436 TaxID=1192034 RepID=A0A017TEL5_9BACT|nr:PPC domain-containing protein [Chondromyces apiculatus]EYF07362.1 Serine protease, subtilase family [Chondromyces apiculatus DSM 436]
MKSTFFLGLLAAGLIAAAAPGCDGDGSDDGPGSGGSGGAGGSTGSNTGGGGGSSTGDGNNSFEEAEDLVIGEQGIQATLEPIEDDVDFYRFTGTKGQALAIFTDAKPDGGEFNIAYPDLVITLFDADQNQIAENDDPVLRNSNDSEIQTILPADGDYYIRVTECNKWLELNGLSGGCSSVDAIENFDYALALGEIDPSQESIVQDTEPNGDEATATPLEYLLAPSGTAYYVTQVYGTFADMTDVDVYSFMLPADPAAEDGKALVGAFEIHPGGIQGNGSTSPVGDFTLVDSSGGVVASVNGALGGELSPPLTAGEQYYLYVKHPGTAAGLNDFYFINHIRHDSNTLETDEDGNNGPVTPEELTLEEDNGALETFVDGQLADGNPQDQDYFSLTLPQVILDNPADWTVSVVCGAQRLGSGVRQLTVEVLNGNGSSLSANHKQTETEAEAVQIDSASIPATVQLNKLLLHVSAGSAGDAAVLSRFYRCAVYLNPVAQDP